MDTKFTPGPLRVEQPDSWPFPILIVNADGERIEALGRYACASGQKTLADCLDGAGFAFTERQGVVERLQRQVADAHLRAAAPDLYEALETVMRPYGLYDTAVANAKGDVSHLLDAGNRIRGALLKARGEA